MGRAVSACLFIHLHIYDPTGQKVHSPGLFLPIFGFIDNGKRFYPLLYSQGAHWLAGQAGLFSLKK